jgi:hypothetical protein
MPENAGLCLENSTFSAKLNFFFSSGSNFDFSSRGKSREPYELTQGQLQE